MTIEEIRRRAGFAASQLNYCREQGWNAKQIPSLRQLAEEVVDELNELHEALKALEASQ